MMVLLPAFATKRLPELSSAKPCGLFRPVLAKTVPVPPGVNFSIVLLPEFDTKRFPAPSNARPHGLFRPVAAKVPRSSPLGENSSMVLAYRVPKKKNRDLCYRDFRRTQWRCPAEPLTSLLQRRCLPAFPMAPGTSAGGERTFFENSACPQKTLCYFPRPASRWDCKISGNARCRQRRKLKIIQNSR